MVTALISTAASDRLAAATRFLSQFSNSTEILVIGDTRAATDDFVRYYAREKGATFGLHRFSLVELAARVSVRKLAADAQVPSSALAIEATIARTVHEAQKHNGLRYFSPVALLPGFAKAVRETCSELRDAHIQPSLIEHLPSPAPDVAILLTALEQQLSAAHLVDHSGLVHIASDLIRHNEVPLISAPLLLLDVPIHSDADKELIAAMVSKSTAVFITVPEGDEKTLNAVQTFANTTIQKENPTTGPSPLGRLRKYLFSPRKPPSGNRGDQVRMFSAPGEGRECVEIARRILEEVGNGVRFDQIAVFLRSPSTYSGLLESAFRRAGIPAFFSFGTSRPDPAGRAFLAVLACADEKLSASRFAEYLSLSQVPALDQAGSPPPTKDIWIGAKDEVLNLGLESTLQPELDASAKSPLDANDSDDSPQIAGTLRAPWNWERLLVDAAVIGGRDRWERRINGLEVELRLKSAALIRDEPQSPRASAIERTLRELSHLKNFALPIVERLSQFPKEAHWGEWLKILQSLAPIVLRNPERVLPVLGEMMPLEGVGPVSLFEVRKVLLDRLATLEPSPPDYRYGHVFVAQTGRVRAYSFDIVFIPGLAEQIFPRRPREDPILLDNLRELVGPNLRNQAERVSEERLLLRLCAGAVSKRLYLSYPRLDVAQGRPRVPSFYALDIDRAITGEVPRVETFEYRAGEEGSARLAWPAPSDPNRAIDSIEHDLSVIGSLLSGPPEKTKGRARYLLDLNENLARSLRTRFARWNRKSWTGFDGLCGVSQTTVDLFSHHRLTERSYSASSLQKFAACPYQFYLSAIQALGPRREVVSIERLDPLTRGAILHRIQAELLRHLLNQKQLPLSSANYDYALLSLDRIIRQTEQQYRDTLAPAIPSVWNDEIEGLRTDLLLWVKQMCTETSNWLPIHFELSFGIPDGAQRDPASFNTVGTVAKRFKLHGIVDLIEERSTDHNLRITDYKSGEARTPQSVVVAGGEVLQPTLYALAVESLVKRPVVEGRLYYCTATGGFAERAVTMNAQTRLTAEEVLKIIDNAVAQPFLPPAPRERACSLCDFQVVCGPYEEIRATRKDQKPLSELIRLRAMQ